MFRRKDPFGRSSSKEIFNMADFCSVLLMAKTLRETKNLEKLRVDDIPMVREGRLSEMPEEVAEEFDTVFAVVIEQLPLIHKYGKEDYQTKLSLGDIDFVGDIVNSDEYNTAIGNVLARKYKLSRGYSTNEAYDDAYNDFKNAKDEIMRRMSDLLVDAVGRIASKAEDQGIPFENATKILRPRLEMIQEEGIVFAVELLKPEEVKALTSKNTGFDPSVG